MKRFFYLLFLVASCKTISQTPELSYPILDKQSVVENIHGVEVRDDFRNIENIKDSTVLTWFRKQSEFTDTLLGKISRIDTIYNKLNEYGKRTKTWAKSLKQDDYGNAFYLRKPEGKNQPYNLYYRPKDTNEEIELLNPDTYRTDRKKYHKIAYMQPSWDGKYVAMSMNHSKNFASEIIVINVKTKEIQKDLLENNSPEKFGGITWLPNSKGFMYLYFPVVIKEETGYQKNSKTLLHMLGSESVKGEIVFDEFSGDSIDSNLFPLTKITSSKDKYVFGYVGNPTMYAHTYYTTVQSLISGSPEWEYLYGPDALINRYSTLLNDNEYYFLTAKESSNYKLCSVNVKNLDFENAKTIVAENKNEIINDFQFTSKGLYYSTTKNGVEPFLYFKKGNELSKVKFPFQAGRIKLIPTNLISTDIKIEIDGWANDLMRYHVQGNKISNQIILAEIPKYPEFENFISEEIMVKGHDGEMIPVSLIYNKEMKGIKAPLLVESYGAYGKLRAPVYDPNMLTWIDLGGIMAIPHIRGGGEKGKNWHFAGRKATKSNSWKDIISVTEYLIANGYTDANKTVLYGASAGSISQGMAMIERPDLFKVFTGRVPLLNPSRQSAGDYKQASFVEFGRLDDPLESKSLLAMDPYVNLKEKVDYPATILFGSAKDDRLGLYETGKFIAKLQDNKSSKNPYLLNVNFDQGHNSTRKDIATIFGFALWVIENENK